MLFELVGGGHVQGGRKYVRGDRIETDKNLCQMFRGKFKLLDGGGEASPGAPIIQPVIPKTADTEAAEKKVAEATVNSVKKLASGIDMTMTFPEAKGSELQVMKISEDQFMFAKNGFVEVVGLFTRAEVVIFLKNHNA